MKSRRSALPAALCILALSSLGACATGGDNYQGIPLAAADTELGSLARRASEGEKSAQLALGIRFETGDGVPVDLRRAERLYEFAAQTSGQTRDMYIPPVRPGSSGRVLPRWLRPTHPGFPAAQARLEALRERRRSEGTGGGN